jgi:hypothetical protein
MVQYSMVTGGRFDEIGTINGVSAGSLESRCMKGYDRDRERMADCSRGRKTIKMVKFSTSQPA